MTSIYHLFFPGNLEKDVRFSWIKDTLLPNANKLIDVTKMKIKQAQSDTISVSVNWWGRFPSISERDFI